MYTTSDNMSVIYMIATDIEPERVYLTIWKKHDDFRDYEFHKSSDLRYLIRELQEVLEEMEDECE